METEGEAGKGSKRKAKRGRNPGKETDLRGTSGEVGISYCPTTDRGEARLLLKAPPPFVYFCFPLISSK